MLYVFHVDSGNMMTLDMSLATETVQTLKEYVEEVYKIPAEHQVLLISGGECLDSSKRVCSYSAGTDTNPIYLFSRSIYDSAYSQGSVLDFREEQEIILREKKSAELPPSFQTVDKRAQLSQEFSDRAKYLLRFCENLVTDQHNQHQGWAAVVANFEDVLTEFQGQFEQLKTDFEEYMQEREYFCQFLQRFNEGLHALRKIPVVPKLLKPNDNSKYLMETSQTSEGASQNAFEDAREQNITLFDWINSDDHENNLEMMYERCCFALEFYNEHEYNKIANEVAAILRSAGIKEMREIRGLGMRLFTLDKVLQETKDKLQQQNDLAISVIKNQDRVQDLKDSSILPDLCSSHIRQLSGMSKNHLFFLESCAKCIRTKDEMSQNLSTRLQYVMHTQNHMQKIGDQIEVFIENIAKLRYQLGILEQVDMAPAAYLSCIAEIVRRRSFSQAFLVWASELACRLLTIHNDEVARRKDFQSKFEGHFIHSLFPGMDDLPPSYGTQAPSYFDTGLPKLNHEDVEFFKKELPELAEYLNIPDFSDSPYVLLFKSILNPDSDKMDEAACNNMMERAEDPNELADNVEKSLLKDGGSLGIAHGLPHLKDLDRGCESETDTEEFEKVGQSPLDLNFDKEIPSPRPSTQDASTLTEGNLEISKSQYDKLKTILFKLGKSATQTIVQLRSELDEVRSQYLNDKSTILQQLHEVIMSCESLCVTHESLEKQLVQRLTTEHSNEINDFRKLAQVKNEEIKSLRTNNAFLENRVKKISDELSKLKEESDVNEGKRAEMEKKIAFLEVEKDRSVKEVTERLTREYRNEMKTLQARFKLMTMERTPSESSLEKTMEFSSLTNHESIINQMRENFELEKEKTVRETLASEGEKWERMMEQLRVEFETEKDLLLTNMSSRFEGEKQDEFLKFKNREDMLLEEINHYTTTIEQLTNAEVDNSRLVERVVTLENENESLNNELQKLRHERLEMSFSSSCSPRTDKTDSATSPLKQRKSLSKSFSVSSGKVNKISTESMREGDNVVVVWDEEHESYKIAQDSSVIYFLHPDSLVPLNLEVSDGPPKKPNKYHCLGEYVDKEYCHAKKAGNRYKVPAGTRFFRIKVRPLERKRTPQPSPNIDIPMTQSQITSHRTSSGSTTEPEFHSLPSSPKIRAVSKDSQPEFPLDLSGDNETTECDSKNL